MTVNPREQVWPSVGRGLSALYLFIRIRQFFIVGMAFLAAANVKSHAADLPGDQLLVIGADRDKDDFERVTVHLKYYSGKSETNFDVLVYAKNEIGIIHSPDRTKIGINACAATKSNDVTLVYVKNHRVVVAPHISDWLSVGGEQDNLFNIQEIGDQSTTFVLRLYNNKNDQVINIPTASVFK